MIRLIKTLLVCAVCMVPAQCVIYFYGANAFSLLPLFWGGMVYDHYISEMS